MKVYIVQVKHAEDEPWKIFKILKDEYEADQIAKSLRQQGIIYPNSVVTEYAVY